MPDLLRFLRGRLRYTTASELPNLAWRALRSVFWRRLELRFYMMRAERVRSLPDPRPCRRDCFEDLQHYERFSYYQLDKDAYVLLAEERRKSGGHLYTRVEDGVLAHYGWLMERQEAHEDRRIGRGVRFPEGSAVLRDFATHPSVRGRGLYRETLWQCLHDAVTEYGASEVWIYVDWDNRVSRRVIEKIGFEYQGSISKERVLLWTVRRQNNVG
jgi:RimJ/RimL family protein N-acetyltransferase